MTRQKSLPAKTPSDTLARRAPRQERAQLTVNAILAGAARVLADDGFAGINTNSIAAAAGVSIGSLYQYFSNKDEVVLALIERQAARMTAIITHGIQVFANQPLAALVRGLISTVLEAELSEQGFFRVLRGEIPRTSNFSKLDEVLDDAVRMLSFAFTMRATELSVKDPQTAAFLVVHAVDGIFDAATRKGLVSADSDRLIDEVSRLVQFYLQA